MEISTLESDCLASHHSILNIKPTNHWIIKYAYQKVPKTSLHPIPKLDGYPKSMNKQTLNKPAMANWK